VDVYIELLAVAFNLNFARATEATPIVAGTYKMKIVPAGAGIDAVALVQTTLDLQGGKTYIFLFTGTSGALTLSTFEEKVEPLNAQESRVTVIHAVPRGADFVLRAGNTDLTPALTFGQESSPVTVPSGQTDFVFLSGTTVLQSYPVNLRERFAHTLILVGKPDDLSSLQVLDFETRVPGQTSVRTLNGSPLLTEVDVYLNDTMLASSVAYGRMSERQSVVTDVYTIGVYAVGAKEQGAEPLTVAQMNANPDDIITLVIIGPPENLRIVTYREDLTPTNPDETRMAFLNTLETVRTARVEFDGGPIPGVPDLGYGQVSAPVTLNSGIVNIYWNRVEGGQSTDNVESGTNLQLDAGRSYLYLLTGVRDAPPLIFSDNVGIGEADTSIDPDIVITQTPEAATRMRFVSAISTGTLVDFLIDDVVVAPAVSYGVGTEFTDISRAVHVVTVRNTGSGALLGREEINVELASNYSVFAYGSETASQIDLLAVPDFNLTTDSTAASLRLINLTQDRQVTFGLVFTAGEVGGLPDGTTRQSIPIGAARVLDGVQTRSFSTGNYRLSGVNTLYLTDQTQVPSLVVAGLVIDLQAGIHYDVIAFHEFGSQNVRLFVLPYPQ
jgi:hypothetical protein